MIIINNTSSANTIEIPVTYAKSDINTTYSLSLRNTVRKTSNTIENLTDTSTSDFFYKFSIDFSTYKKGEYEFKLIQANEELASGIIRLTDSIDRETYSKTIEYKYYSA